MFSIALSIYLGVELLSNMVTLFLTFQGTARLYLKLYILHAHQENAHFIFLPISLHLYQHYCCLSF